MKKRSMKSLAVLLAIVCLMSIALTACGNTSENPGNDTQHPESQTPTTQTPTTQTPTTQPHPTQPPADETTEWPFELFASDLPDGYKKVNEQTGTVVEELYTTYAYDNDGVAGEAMEARMYVYLPYDYDESQQYDVLYLMHGGGEAEGYWFGMDKYAEGGEKYNKAQHYCTNMLDNMFANGDCANVIIVTPTTNNNGTDKFPYELNNDIIPYIESKYSTYAAGDVSTENLIATRDHRAFAGFSMGSITTRNVWQKSLEYIAYLGNYSGFDPNEEGSVDNILALMNEGGAYADYELKYWFNATGDLDTAERDHLDHYARILEGGSSFLQEGEDYMNGDNCIMVDKPGFGHAYNGWVVDLYNSLLVFFKVP